MTNSKPVLIKGYIASWNYRENKGIIKMHRKGGGTTTVRNCSAAEFALMLQFLQNDKDPYNIKGGWISSGPEIPGDED